MTDEDRIREMKACDAMLKDLLAPLISADGKKGIVAIRLFYSVEHGDGTASAGNVGVTHQDHGITAARLIKAITGLIADPQGNRTFEEWEIPERH